MSHNSESIPSGRAILPIPWLERQNKFVFLLFCGMACFITYCSMYAFRKPFTSATYNGKFLWGVDFKMMLIIFQLLGYTVSKFIGIKIVSELDPSKRISALILLMSAAWLTLLLFAVTPYPYNAGWMFVNGLPLGMIWGVVFSFIEGRRQTEFLGAFMASSFIVASGVVKAVGLSILQHLQANEFWMPFITALLFIPLLLLGIWMLQQIPPPDEEDEKLRSPRIPMDKKRRNEFLKNFGPGILIAVLIYVMLTIFRDLRDNFAVELWTALGFANAPSILIYSELPVGVGVLIIIASMIAIKNNKKVLDLSMYMVITGGVLLLTMTYLLDIGIIGPAVWMIILGFALYLPYIVFHTMLFERWIAHFRNRGNIGFLMYLADAAGYFGSILVLLYKNFGEKSLNWLEFFRRTAFQTGFIITILAILLILYFRKKENQEPKVQTMLYEE
jgi:hypothetical protein